MKVDCSWDFKGKTCIITGAANGIGLQTSLLLAKSGANLVLVDNDQEKLPICLDACHDISSSKHISVVADISDESQVRRTVDLSVETFQKIDFLVAGAGILYRTPFSEIQLDEWDELMNVNLRGLFLCNQMIVEEMLKHGSGRIVNIASVAGRSMSLIGGAHYATSKHAVIGLSRHMARELSQRGIRVNAFCPGATKTAMIDDNLDPQQVEELTQRIGLGRLAEPEEQARVVAFMLSDAASYMSGACVDSNGASVML